LRNRRVLRFIFIVACSIFVLLGIGVALLHTPTAKWLAFEQVRKILQAQGIVLEVADFDYNLLAFHVSSDRVLIRGVSAPELPSVFTADHMTADLDLFDLIAGRYRVKDLVLTNPKIQIVIDEQGGNNIPGTASTSTAEPIDWLILKMRSTGGSLTFEDRSQNTFATLPLWDLAVDGSRLTGTQEIHLQSRQAGEARYQGKTIRLESLDAQVLLKDRNQTLEVRAAHVSSDVADVATTGTIETLNDPQLDLAVTGSVHLQPASRQLAIEERIEGDLNVSASVKGRVNELKVAGRVAGDNLTAQMIQQIAVDIDLIYDAAAQRAQLNSFDIRSPQLSLGGTADVALGANAGESRIDARLTNVDLQAISKILKAPVAIASRATGEARLRWSGIDFTGLDGNARLRLSALRPGSHVRRVPLSGGVRVNSRGGNTVASIDALDTGAIHLRGQVTLESLRDLGGTLQLDTSNIGDAVKQIADWSGSVPPEAVHIFGPASIGANLGGTLERPRVSARLEANDLQVNELKNISLDAVAEYTTEQIDLQTVALKWEEQSLTGSGRIGLTSGSPTLEAHADIPGASIHGILAALGQAEVPADGNVSIAAAVSGTVENPAATVKLSASNLEAYGEPFGTLSAEAHLENQSVQLDSFLLEKAEGGQLQASGHYEIASGTFGGKAGASNLKLERLVLPQGTTISADVSFGAEGSGTLDNPTAAFKLNSRDLQIDGERIGPIDLNSSVENHDARINVSAPSYAITANAAIGTVQPYPTTVQIHATDTDVADLLSGRLTDLSGRVSATVNASGHLADINGAQVRAEVPNLNLRWRNRAITSDGPIDVQYGKRELTISRAAFRVDDSTVRLSGNLPLDAGSTGQLSIEGRANLATLTDLIPSETPIHGEGQIVLEGTFLGNLQHIDPRATLTITQGSIDTSALPARVLGLNLKATAQDGRLVLDELSGDFASAKFNVQGEVPFALLPSLPVEIPRSAGPARLSAEIVGFKLSSLSQPPQNSDGTISLKIEAEAPRPELELVQGQVTFSELRLNAGTYALEQAGASTIDIRDGIASIRQFELTGTQTNIRVTGTAELRDPGTVDVKLEGNTDAAVLGLFDNDVRATGETRLNVAVRGTVREPKLNGFVEVENGQAQIEDPRITLENLQLRLDLNGSRIELTRLESSVNGGSIKGEGGMDLSGAQLSTARVAVIGEGIYFEYPAGVRTVSNLRLSLTGDSSRMKLSGNIDVIDGTYTDQLTVERGLLRYLESEQSTITVMDQPSAVNRTQLDIGLRTLSPLVVNNNVAHGNINADLRILGTVDEPGLTGRIDIEEGAELRLREREYSIDRGVITFTNDQAIEPILDIQTTTKVADYTITMQISGDVTRKVDTVLTCGECDPPLSEADIVSLIVTGHTIEKAGASGAQVAKEQALSYVAGELGASIGGEAGRALGLSQVRIEPNLIAGEAEPTARLTLGKDITPKLDFVYSMNLRNSSDQIWIADYDLTRRFSARALRQPDASYRFQFQHGLLFGLTEVPSTSTSSNIRRKIGAIQFIGATRLNQDQLSKAAGLKTGKTYDFSSVQNARDRLEKTFAKQNRFETRISIDRKLENSTADLTFRIKEGPKIEFIFEGWNVSNDLKQEIRNAWSAGVIDVQRVGDVTELIKSALVRDRYFDSRVDSSIEMLDSDTKRILLKIQPGVRYDEVRAGFEGVQGVDQDELQTVLKDRGLFEGDLQKRKEAPSWIANVYRDRGYIDVNVDSPRNELIQDSKTVVIVFPVTEGPLYRFGEITFEGNTEYTDADLLTRFPFESESPFRFETVQDTQRKLQDLYRKNGYNDVAIQYSQVKDVSKKIVDVTFTIQENYQRIFKQAEVEGNQKTSANLVRAQIAFKSGDIVSYDKLSQARSNLYNTGAYSFVEITVTSLEGQTDVKANQAAVRLIVRVREVQPWQLRYGGFYDTERGPGGLVDVSNHNMLGSARVAGMQTRYDSDLREVRTYFSQPTLHGFPLKSIFSAFQRHEYHRGDDEQSERDDVITDRIGFSPSFEYRLRTNNVLTFGYRFENTHTFEKIPHPIVPFDIRLRVAPLTNSFTRDTRDDALDASHGRFTSHTLEWGLATLGSELRYLKYFGQYFAYVPLSKPTIVPWANTSRNRLVAAMGARVGLAGGLGGQQIIPSERFFTGGSTTVRGFEEELLGPIDFDGKPLGGDAMLVLNSELRFPLYSFFDGVAFADAGNVYTHLANFKPFDLRSSYGLGLRIRTPYVVLRLDYGIKIGPRPGEAPGKLFFSIGQAF
jgi:outer membrane protein assembly complex protein YaeT